MPVNTPNLDAFSEKAASVENVYASSFPTIPHRTDLTTARTGWPWYPWQPLANSSNNHTPSLLKAHNYVSQLICDCPHLFKAGFQGGFDAAYQLRGQEGDMPFLRMNYPIRKTVPLEKTRPEPAPFKADCLADLHSWTNRHWRSEKDRFARRTAATAVEWLEENYLYDPFFLWVDLFDPHEPWDPPEYMVRKYDPDYNGTPMIHPNYGRADDYTDAELTNLRAHYCAEAELVDRGIGRMLEKIEDLGLDRNSVIVFTSDHGMSLGEHNRTGKTNINPGDERSWPIYPEVAHIPLMIAAPNVKGGHSIQHLALPEDILPTVAELAGLNIKPQDAVHGVSLASQLQEKSNEETREVVVTGNFLNKDRENIPDTATVPVVYTAEWAYVPFRPDGSAELYYLPADPLAEKDVAEENKEILHDMHQKFMNYLDELEAPEETKARFSG